MLVFLSHSFLPLCHLTFQARQQPAGGGIREATRSAPLSDSGIARAMEPAENRAANQFKLIPLLGFQTSAQGVNAADGWIVDLRKPAVGHTLSLSVPRLLVLVSEVDITPIRQRPSQSITHVS